MFFIAQKEKRNWINNIDTELELKNKRKCRGGKINPFSGICYLFYKSETKSCFPDVRK